MKITYNQIVNLLSDFFEAHYQVETFKNGDLWEAIQSNSFKDALYPLAFLVDAGGNTTQGKIGLTFDLLCMDLINKNESNENEVKSDTLQILTDTVAFLEQLRDGDWYSMNVVKESNLSSFTESFDDELTGWKITVTLNQPFNYNACEIPYDGVSVGDEDCQPVTVTDSDGTTVTEVPSGGTFTCTPVSPSIVTNSDGTYNETVASGGTLILPNINFTDSNGVMRSVPAMTDIIATPCEVPFSPGDISGLEHWFDVLDATTITKDGSNRVSNIGNKGSGNDMNQLDINKQPLFVTGGFGGNMTDHLYFDGIDDYMTFNGASLSVCTVFLVWQTVSSAMVGDTIITGVGGTNFKRVFANGLNNTFISDNGGVNIITGMTPQILSVKWQSGTNMRYKFNDSSFVDAITGGNSTVTDFNIGDWHIPVGTRTPEIKFTEVLYYNSELTDTDVNKVMNYLNDKYGKW